MDKLILYSIITSLIPMFCAEQHIIDKNENMFDKKTKWMIHVEKIDIYPVENPQISKQKTTDPESKTNNIYQATSKEATGVKYATKESVLFTKIKNSKGLENERKKSTPAAESLTDHRINSNGSFLHKLSGKSLSTRNISSSSATNERVNHKTTHGFNRHTRPRSHHRRYGRFLDTLASSIFKK